MTNEQSLNNLLQKTNMCTRKKNQVIILKCSKKERRGENKTMIIQSMDGWMDGYLQMIDPYKKKRFSKF